MDDRKLGFYCVIQHYDLQEFQYQVDKAIRNGWKVLGGISVSSSNTGDVRYYHQAMVR